MLFSFDVQISFCFPFFFLKLMIPQVILRRSQPSMKAVPQATIMWSAASKFYLLMMQTFPEVV